MLYPNWLPGWCSGKDSACQCRRHKRHSFHPWVRKIPFSRIWHPTLVFLPGKFHGQRPLWATVYGGSKESDMTKQAYKHMHKHPNFMMMLYFLLQFTDSSDKKRWSLWLLETLTQKNTDFSRHCWKVIFLIDGIGICKAFTKSK